MQDTQKNKAAAVDFLESVTAGKIRQAYEKHVSPKFRHHNAYFPGDAASLMAGMEESHKNFPSKILKIHNVIAEGDRVAIQSEVKMNAEHIGYALTHIFKFEDGRIVELWDMGQAVPESSPNQNGMF